MNLCLLGDARSIHVRRLAQGLASLEARVHVVTHRPQEIPGVTVERFRVPGASLFNPRRWIGRRQRCLRGFVDRFDVVSVQFLDDWGFDPSLMERGCVVATAWGSDVVPPPGEGSPTPELIQARMTLLHHAAAVTACGPSFAALVAEYAGLAAERIDVLPFGVDLRLFDPERVAERHEPASAGGGHAPKAPANQGGIVGFFKGFRAVYGATVLIRAIPLILERLARVRFELVGDGVQLEECQSMARSLGVDACVTFVPRRRHEDLPAMLSGWDLSVIPSVHEAFGVAALESSAMGVPVVASDVCGLRDTVVDGQTGRRFRQGDSEALAGAVVDLLSDPPLRRRMGAAGRAFVAEHFEVEDVSRRWLRFFHRVREQRCVMV